VLADNQIVVFVPNGEAMNSNPYESTSRAEGLPNRGHSPRWRAIVFGIIAFVVLVPLLDWLALQVIVWNTHRQAREGKQSEADTAALLDSTDSRREGVKGQTTD
jgi:hypothetical protein